MSRLAWANAHLGFALLCGLLALPAGAAEPTSGAFREWLAGCDNLGRCTALSLPVDGASFPAMLMLQREARPAAPPVLTLTLKADTLPELPLVANLAVDGAPFPSPGAKLTVERADLETGRVRFTPEQIEALVAAMRKATAMTATMARDSYEIPLAGAVAAMLWLDERQGRLSTPTALIRKGDTSPTRIPQPAPLPIVTPVPTKTLRGPTKAQAKALAAAMREQLQRTDPDACEDNEPARGMDSAVQIDRRSRLVMLSCLGGAYNYTTSYWIVPGSDVAKARKLAFQQPGKPTGNRLINAEYDPATGQIAFLEKGRGPGDCGRLGGYAWTGKNFVLTTYAEMPRCQGLLPDDWLVLWRSEVKAAK
ncbi:DUF1176 domain-containing protein [Bosea vaviloviae]|uniref:DUF1176 domain-containing protein n=1 Tax=Bosea vaviloviae TaxID=1526658 RepID=A0A1D7U867_9HYPH|nr:DUF1176 domain-containing protein [Bosea vaviloviae]AOO83568.1 hypothetical protein BHK69_26775 [Bosea vaviloviae]